MMRSATHLRRQQGVSLLSAVFLIVALAGLAVFAVRLSLLQQQTVNASLRAAQAYHAARSGVAWAARRAVADGWCGSATLSLGEAGTVGFELDISCASTSHVERGAAINVYVIEVLAEAGVYGGPDYVSRRLQAKITDAG
jgi:MSHA biogenesis protein MshP